jgi:glycosyltransferase involved in cell wall biosynthesis
MHVLYLHQNFPAQFGPAAAHLVGRGGDRVTFVSNTAAGRIAGVERIAYQPGGGATARTHYCSRTFENAVWHGLAAYEALRARPDVRPDLVVAHSGFLSTLPLRELYDCPIINYFEYFYHAHGSDLDFRPDVPVEPIDRVRARFRNATLLLDLHNCDLGYSPTHWQRDRLPALFHPKLRVIFDGIDTQLWRPPPRRPVRPRQAGKLTVPEDVKLVTYVSRGLESMRGFDVFMRLAKVLCDRRPDVRFLVVGQDRVCYGGDAKRTGGQSFKEWVLAQDTYDLSRFTFTGLLPPGELAQVFAVSDLHIYLTVPFVLSWSLLNALACGALVLASGTAPVREVVEDGRNGLLADFFDVDGLADRACRALDAPAEFEPLRRAAVETVRERYSLEVCLPQQLRLYEEALGRRHEPPGVASPPAATG